MFRRMVQFRSKTRGPFLAAGMFLVNCQGAVTTDLATEAAADPNIEQVGVSLLGLEFRNSDGATQTLEFSASEDVDLTDYIDGDPFRLFSGEQLPPGTYSGVRLLFDDGEAENAYVMDSVGREFSLALVDGEYASVSIAVEEEESSSNSLTLTLDLRQSLSFDESTNEYTLRPVLRSVVTEDAGQIQGTVSSACSFGTSLATGAVYLFQGMDVTPDDRDSTGVEPYATAPVLGSAIGTFSYTLRNLPAGEYTIALTCRGDEENAAIDESLDFRSIRNVELDEAGTLDHDIS